MKIWVAFKNFEIFTNVIVIHFSSMIWVNTWKCNVFIVNDFVVGYWSYVSKVEEDVPNSFPLVNANQVSR